MINFHNEVENLNENTKGVFSNQTYIWSTAEYAHLNQSVPVKMGGSGGQNLTRTDNFVEDGTKLSFDYFANPEEDRFVTDQGQSGYLFSISTDKTKATDFLDKLYKIDFSNKF